MKKTLATVIALFSILAVSFGQKKLTEHTFEYDGTTKTPATINELDWLTGRWTGSGFGGWLEEIWSPPAGGQMLATFRMLENDKPVFSEICQIMEEAGTITYKVKHFNPDLKGWEEKNDFEIFQVVKIEPRAVYFHGLTMVENNGQCDIWLATKNKEGKYREEHIIYKKDKPAPVFPQIAIPQDADNIARLQEIDRDIWQPFAEAYATGDADKYISLHTPDLIRATGGNWIGLQDLATYGANSRQSFMKNKTNNKRVEIAFSFFERVAGTNAGSERGIYRFTAIEPDGQRRDAYGKFHVFLRKINGNWKIAIDYDSNENGAVGEADFNAGLPVGVFTR